MAAAFAAAPLEGLSVDLNEGPGSGPRPGPGSGWESRSGQGSGAGTGPFLGPGPPPGPVSQYDSNLIADPVEDGMVSPACPGASASALGRLGDSLLDLQLFL